MNRQLAFWVLLATKGMPKGSEIACHLDDDPSHNDLGNLVWSVPAANGLDRQLHTPQPHSDRCERGHGPALRYLRPNGKRSNCRACAKLSRFFPGRGSVPTNPALWPELLRPEHEVSLLRWWELPLHHQLQLGGLEHVTVEQLQHYLKP